jgi:hypothetical protein
MSVASITQENPETRQLVPPPMGNYAQINEYQQLFGLFITMPRDEVKPLITSINLTKLLSEVKSFLKTQLGSLRFESSTFYRIVEVDREPRFVIDVLITVSEFTRDKKFAVLSVIGDLMRKYPELLLDFRITKKIDIPNGYFAI